MLILFVCMGNTYRSRLAEAYLRSLHLPGIETKSAGVHARMNLNGPISNHALQLLRAHKLTKYAKPTWTQLTQAQLDCADVVVCMNRLVQSAALEAGYRLPLRTFVWNIADVNQLLRDWRHHPEQIPHIAQQTFGQICQRVQDLAMYLRRPRSKEMIDIYLPDGTPAGRTADIDMVHAQGLWHQGVHAAVVTASGEALFQQRSESIIEAPGQWDFSLGGIISAGETPERSILRELKEELGIKAARSQLRKLFVYRYNHFLPHYAIHSRVFVHTYVVSLPKRPRLRLQADEVAAAKFLPWAEAEQFIIRGRSALGATTSLHHYYRQLLAAVSR